MYTAKAEYSSQHQCFADIQLQMKEPRVIFHTVHCKLLIFIIDTSHKISIYFLFARPNKVYTSNIYLSFFLSLHEKFLPHTVQHLDVNRCQGLFCCVVVAALTWKRIMTSLWTKSVKWRLSKQKHRSLNCTAMIDWKSFYSIGVTFQKIAA